MITGTLKKEKSFLGSEEILDRTTGGYDIYMFYLGKVARIMNRPWGRTERKPSWGIYPWNGLWLWKDQAREEAGNAIQFVQKTYGLDYNGAINKIASDFGITPNEELTKLKPKVVTWDEPTEEDKVYVRMNFTSKPFQKEHHEFWAGTDVCEARCNRYECWAVKDLAIKGKRFKLRENEVVFAYYAPQEDAVKIYFPERGQDEWNPKFRNNVSGSYLWNYERLLEQTGGSLEKGLIQKSMKDLLVSTLFTENVIAGQNEQSKLWLSPYTQERVGKLFSGQIWMAFGSDTDGMEKSQKVTSHTGWNRAYPDENLLPTINDFYSLAKAQSPKAVENLLKQVHFL
jgi:hypothetical protein